MFETLSSRKELEFKNLILDARDYLDDHTLTDLIDYIVNESGMRKEYEEECNWRSTPPQGIHEARPARGEASGPFVPASGLGPDDDIRQQHQFLAGAAGNRYAHPALVGESGLCILHLRIVVFCLSLGLVLGSPFAPLAFWGYKSRGAPFCGGTPLLVYFNRLKIAACRLEYVGGTDGYYAAAAVGPL